MMKIAMLHYHLNRGGVTQVIGNHLRALNGQMSAGARLPVALMYGGRADGWPDELANQLEGLDLALLPVAGLDYDNVCGDREDLAKQLHLTLGQAGFRPEETVIHIHNHALGKNSALPETIGKLARLGYSCLLHLHDFAEDFRPENYRKLGLVSGSDRLGDSHELLYPQASQIHYAVLNSRDYSILLEAGVESSRLHLLPNPVAGFDGLPTRDAARGRVSKHFGIASRDQLVLYPVRGIRRKNLGEALLWSAMAKRTDCFGLTLAPLNPVEQTSYRHWKECATENDLRWVFDMGGAKGLAFVDNLAAADCVLTTSVAEGFGLVFLEAWLAGCNLVGRDLPEITTDFVAAGLQFPGLNPNFWIPVDMFDEDIARKGIADSFRAVLSSYGQPMPAPEWFDQEIDKLMCNGRLDFAQCGVLTQTQVIKKVASDSAAREVVLAANPWIEDALELQPTDLELIGRNAEIVRTKYSVANCGRQLMAIYKTVNSSDRDDTMQPPKSSHRILDQFLSLSRFHPLRVES